jgi:hypothetical protein
MDDQMKTIKKTKARKELAKVLHEYKRALGCQWQDIARIISVRVSLVSAWANGIESSYSGGRWRKFREPYRSELAHLVDVAGWETFQTQRMAKG